MVLEGGEVRIVGTLDTSQIERGQRRVNVGFEDVKSKAENATGSLSGLRGVGSALTKTFAGVATIGVGALTGLASTAPQTAGALASIGASTKQLGLIAGEELAPAFEKVANLFGEFVDSAGTEGSIVKTSISGISSVMSGLITDLDNATTAVGNFFNSFDEDTTSRASSALSELFGDIREKGLFGTAFGETGLGLPFAKAGELGTNLRETEIGGSVSSFLRERGVEGFAPPSVNLFKLAFNSAKDLFFETDTLGGNQGG
jgi:hypothetical protein